MTREEKEEAINDFCNEFNSNSESVCEGCPLKKLNFCKILDCNWTDEMVDKAYALIAKPPVNFAKSNPDDEIETADDKVDEAHKRFMNIGEIKDSGNRREFETGAVRDIAEGKGRCDLMPLDVVGNYMNDNVIGWIAAFRQTKQISCLYQALDCFRSAAYALVDGSTDKDCAAMLLEAAKHFEEGAKKYGENNWQKGLPINCYIDSAVRHYLKWLRGDKDEPHDRAFVWNILCCAWTVKHIGFEKGEK